MFSSGEWDPGVGELTERLRKIRFYTVAANPYDPYFESMPCASVPKVAKLKMRSNHNYSILETNSSERNGFPKKRFWIFNIRTTKQSAAAGFKKRYIPSIRPCCIVPYYCPIFVKRSYHKTRFTMLKEHSGRSTVID